MRTCRARWAVGIWCLGMALAGMLTLPPAMARDAAFMQPGSSKAGDDDEAVKVEPKSEVEVGDTSIHMTRRTTLFFVNESNAPVQVEKMVVNSDTNVEATISNDDCSKQGSIAPQSRCSVEVSVTPSASGAWTVEALMTHNGAGRIARAKLTGKTTGGGVDEKKESGLAISPPKDATNVDFGDIEVNGKAARSALMVNDSPDPISLYSIDVIEADNDLKVMDSGCTVDMELKPGESCPVTIVWTPTEQSQVSTDLIIRHSGRKGFAVVPIRGKTKGFGTADAGATPAKPESILTPIMSKGSAPLPPSADELDGQMSRIPALPSSALGAKPAGDHVLHLIGTVGNRALLLLPDGSTKVADLDDEIPLDGDSTAKVVSVDAKSVKISVDGKEKTLKLEASTELVAHAVAAHEKSNNKSDSKDKKTTTTTSTSSTSSSTTLPAGSKGASP